MYEKVNEDFRKAQDEAVDLRREIEKLKAQGETARPGTAAGKKRKNPAEEDLILVSRNPNKVKRDQSPTRTARADAVNVDRDFDFSEVGEIGKPIYWHFSGTTLMIVGNILMRSLYQAHTLTKSHHRLEATALAHHLIRAASALPQVVKQSIDASFSRQLHGHELLRSTLIAAGRAFATLIAGINRLSRLPAGAEVQGQVIYAYVQAFSGLIGNIERASEHASKHELSAATTMSVVVEKRPGTSKGRTKAQQPKQSNLKDLPSVNAITVFIAGSIDLLDAGNEVHEQLFEGFFHCLLSKLGARLYTTVFGRARGPTIDSEILSADQEDDIEDTPAPAVTAQEELDVRKAKIEAPCLIHLLARLMAAAPAHLGLLLASGKATKTKTSKTSTRNSQNKASLSLYAKKRLQRTLVNCMFGTEGLSEDDDLFDCLKMPAPSTQPIPMPKVKEAAVQEWFQEEVWRLVGWEILGKEEAW